MYWGYELGGDLHHHTSESTELENSKSYVRMLFVDYSSAFNTIIPDILATKVDHLQMSSMLMTPP